MNNKKILTDSQNISEYVEKSNMNYMGKIKNSAQLNVIKAFVEEWMKHALGQKVLYLKYSEHGVFSAVNLENMKIVSSSNEITKDSKYDLIIGDLSYQTSKIGMVVDGEKSILPQNWGDIFKSLSFLDVCGTGLYCIEPKGFSSSAGMKFEKTLNKHGYYVNAFLNTPEKILFPETSITPIIVAISRIPFSHVFIAELFDEKQSEKVFYSYFSFPGAPIHKAGEFVDLYSFKGFRRLKIKQQIQRLETQYKNYEECSLGSIALEINHVKTGGEFQEKENSIYVPNIGKSGVITNLGDAKLKHHNYFQVVLGELAINEYVAAFFRSTLGKLILESLVSDTLIPHLNKQDLEQASIALPKLADQKSIVDTQASLSRLKSAIEKFDVELALNPTNSNSLQKQLNSMLDAIGELTDAEKIHGIIREGESKRIEFKETLSLDIKKKVKDKQIETSALKTVVAFLNTEGGILLIGISDEGKINGLNEEIEKFYKNVDKFLLQWKNLVKVRIGEEYYPFIETKVISVGKKLILSVECQPSSSPCFLDRNDFYVRTNPATDKLEGPKLVEYVKNHFTK